jgi:hypothetical protein
MPVWRSWWQQQFDIERVLGKTGETSISVVE